MTPLQPRLRWIADVLLEREDRQEPLHDRERSEVAEVMREAATRLDEQAAALARLATTTGPV